MMKRAPGFGAAQFTSRWARGAPAVVVVAGALVALAVRAGHAAAPPASVGEFPGQYALPRPGPQWPAWSKGCRRIEDPGRRLACTEALLDDWPRFDRYATANRELAPPKHDENRVVFMGDSITDMWSLPGRGGFFPGKPYINRGIGGQTTGQMLLRFHADVIALKPRVVVILAGTNDVAGNNGPTTPEAIQDNLAGMAELAHANGIRVVLASVLPVSDDKAGPHPPVRPTVERPPLLLRALNAWIAAYARKNGHVFLDYWSALADGQGMFKPELQGDGLHPNAAGYAVMAPLAEKAIAEALAK
jgi:lysophospholipase L1-like esterase